jgi:hypothetical protein
MTAIRARVSTTGQDLDAQLAALTAAGIDRPRVHRQAIRSAKVPVQAWRRTKHLPAIKPPKLGVEPQEQSHRHSTHRVHMVRSYRSRSHFYHWLAYKLYVR